MRRLSTREQEILAVTYFAADLPVSEVAQIVGCREHTVRHSLQQLHSDGLIKLRPYCNPYALGYKEYVAWLTLSSADRSQRRTLRAVLCESSRTTYVTDVEGQYQIFVMFLAKDIDEIESFFDSVSASASGVSFTKTIGQVSQLMLFTPKRFMRKGLDIGTLSYSPVKESHVLDDLDRKLLVAFASAASASSAELARSVGLPVSTVSYRIKSLMAKGVILAVGYSSVRFDDGIVPFGLLINITASSAQMRGKLRQFCKAHPRTSALLDVVGPWEHQVEVELHDVREITEIVQEFYDSFPSYIKNIQTIPIGSTHKLTPYPLSV